MRSGTDQRGCGYRVKKARIYVQLHLQNTSFSRRVVRLTIYLTNKGMTKDSRRFSPWFQCVENNRTDPLIWSSRWMDEGTDLRWWGRVISGTSHPKHKATWFVWTFRILTVMTLMRVEKHSHLTCCSWLSSKNDTFVLAHINFGSHPFQTRETTVKIVIVFSEKNLPSTLVFFFNSVPNKHIHTYSSNVSYVIFMVV